MPVTGKIQIEGGLFQNFEGSPLANGYLIVQLSHDEQESVDPGLVTGLPKIKITLDSNGNIPASPAVMIWPNDQLLPGNSFYTVVGYASDGAQVFGPQYWNLTSAVSPYNVANQQPTNPPGSGLGGSGQSLILETNGTQNSNQALLNLANGSNVTITNSAGTTTISASGGPSFNTSGQGGFWSAGLNVSGIGGTTATTVTVSPVANQITAIQFELFAGHTIRTVSCFVITSVGSSSANFGVYNASGAKLLDSGAIATTSGGRQLLLSLP